nr:heterokaryon incompatibility protein 6, or allele [Quercus suber]
MSFLPGPGASQIGVPSDDMTSLGYYLHSPLHRPDNIRLICLEPAPTFTGEIRCILIEVNLQNVQLYEALSYSWGETRSGESLATKSITCHGQKLPVPEGAFSALRRLRRLDRVRYLWIDSICIDQSSNVERSHQVQMMASIFAGASRVLAWVGEDDKAGDGKLTIAFLIQVAREISIPAAGAGLVNGPKLNKLFSEAALKHRQAGVGRTDSTFTKMIESQSEMQRAMLMQPEHDSNYDIFIINFIVTFLKRRWFERRWVVQEMYQATKACIVCGPHDVELQWFRRGLMVIWRAYQQHLTSDTISKAILESAIELCTTRHDESTLLAIYQPPTIFHKLCYCAPFKCSDPRDLLYSFLGIHNPFSIIPDYSAPIATVFYNFAHAAIQHGWAAAILFLAAVQVAKPVNMKTYELLPSWVPDWRRGVQPRRRQDAAQRAGLERLSKSRQANLEPKAPNLRPLLSGTTGIRAMLSSTDQTLLVYGRNLGSLSLAQGYANLDAASSTDSFLVKLGAPQQSNAIFDLFALDSGQAETLGLLLLKMTADRREVYEIKGWCWIVYQDLPREPAATICIV